MIGSNGMSRRRFLACSAGTLAAAAPLVVPSSVLGKDGAVAPSERITMGAIGIGGRGRYDLGALMGNPDVQMVAVCDTRGDRRRQARETVDRKYGNKGCAAYIDFYELLGRSDIDAVLIATGENWHALLSILAAKAGKDIYCEKPPSHTIAEGRALAETIRRYGTVYQCGTQRRSIPRFRFAVELARSGKLGRLKTLYAEAAGRISVPGFFSLPPQAAPSREEVDWDRWLGPAPWRPYNKEYLGRWKRHRDFQGGSVAEWGSHTADLCQFAAGADTTGPVDFERTGDTITARYADGVRLVFINGAWPLHVKFEGTEGWVYVDDGGKIEAEPKSLLEDRRFGKGYPAEGHARSFLDCVKTRKTPISNAEATHRSMSVCHIANMCLLLGRKLTWDPQKERFAGDAEADRMRARAIRQPWRM